MEVCRCADNEGVDKCEINFWCGHFVEKFDLWAPCALPLLPYIVALQMGPPTRL
jgi:hypothetical protein